jgi:hypothetical protein
MSEFSTHSRRARFLPGWNTPRHKRVPRFSSDSARWIAIETFIKPPVMASEISGLESLRGFIKQENRVVPVWFQLTTKRNKQSEFIERKMPAFPPKPVETTVPSTKRPVSSTAPEKPARSITAFRGRDSVRCARRF